MSWIEEWIRPGMTVVDVGANQGEFTKLFRQAIGPEGVILAIEPHAPLAEVLRTNGASEVLTAVATDHAGPCTLYESQNSQHASLYPANVLEPVGFGTGVNGVTLDDVVQTCDAIKVDTQGAEMAILRGATRLLREVRPVWYLEIWKLGLLQAGSSVDEVCSLLDAAGYVPHASTWEQVRASAIVMDGHGSIDVCVIPRERAGQRAA